MTPVTPLIKEKKTKVFPIFVACALAFQGVLLFLLFIQFIFLYRISSRPVPTLVQLLDGRAIQVKETEMLQRSPETIRRFVSETMTLMFDWSGNLPPETVEEARSPQSDPGVPIEIKGGKDGRVTTSSWEASFALSEDFRRGFIERVADLTPSGVFSENRQSQGVMVLKRVSMPEEIAPGEWKVILISNLYLFSSNDQAGSNIPYNREIYVRAVDPPSLPLAEKSSALERVVFRARQSGLEIYKIRDLPRESL